MPEGKNKDFSDGSRGSKLKAIEVWHGDRIDSLKCWFWDGSSTDRHGKIGGSEERFVLDPNEEINTVFIWSDDRLRAIQFGTTTGRMSKKYGGSGGDHVSHPIFDANTKLWAVGGFWGMAGDVIEVLNPYWVDSSLKSSQFLIDGNARGGNNTNLFSMINDLRSPLSCILWKIRTRSGGSLDHIDCYFDDFTSQEIISSAGGTGGSTIHIFKLDPGEYIVEVKARLSGGTFKALEFLSNRGRFSPLMGNESGDSVTWKAPQPGYQTYGLLCFAGRAEGLIDSLYPIWAPVRSTIDFE